MIENVSEDSPVITSQSMDWIYKIREKRHDYKGANIYVTDFILEDDPWHHYQIVSQKWITFWLDNKSLWTIVRIDSGCDSGQIYGDDMCECREQLHEGIDAMLQEWGIVIHIPTQDGRWYGCATKMETEGLKEWLAMMTNGDHVQPMDTVKAAEHLFGAEYDIRTFHGAGKILHALGFRDVILLTGNIEKISHLASAGIRVETKNIKVDKASCVHHTNAKYATPLYTQ